jgi:putative membrane protein
MIASQEAQPPAQPRPAAAIAVILAVSAAAFLFLCWLLFWRHSQVHEAGWIAHLPAVNATLNGLSTVLLLCYIIYHNAHGDTRFVGAGPIRPVYFFILISHIALSAVALPLILTSFYLALTGRFDLHPRVSRVTYPIWLYVSVTGVLVFLLLRFANH